MTKKLMKAREYEKAEGEKIKSEERPKFHLTAWTGWMNDPNGFCYYKNKYHMFFQYHPYSVSWGPMHWGHAVSTDLLHWQYLPAALAPEESYDAFGCFSGSAAALPDGRHLLMYTGVALEPKENGQMQGIQRQCLAIGDGIEYEKYEKNPVLDAADLPEGGSIYDFRDPKIWQAEDGTYFCAAVNLSGEGYGQVLLYHSGDGFSWQFKSILKSNDHHIGKMWECPDFFKLDGKWVLIVSPQDMLPEGFEFINGDGTLCMIGTYDEDKGIFIEENHHSIDYGIDFYAPQTVQTPDGRRIMIGWAQNWDSSIYYPPGAKWFGQMSLPRELSIKNGRLYQWPLKEIESLWSNKVVYEHVKIKDTMKLDGIRGRKADIEITIRPADKNKIYKTFEIHFAENEHCYSEISYKPENSMLKIDRTFSGSRRAVLHQRCSQVRENDGVLSMRIILDRYSVEVFVNGGEQVLTMIIETEQSADGISFFSDETVEADIVKYDLSL